MFTEIKKLFKALNSSSKSWQLSGAVVLAMFAGFLPSSSLILLDLLFIALILNINFGLFLLFSVIFSGIGYVLDPVFESIGYSVLTNDGLDSLFTSMYNSAMWRWSAFNYTLVTGALVVSLVLSVPMMFILGKVITVYKTQIGEKLNQWKLTKWMGLFNEEAQKTSFFRWWGLGVFGGLAAFIVVIFIFLFDPLVRMGMEKGLSYSLETEVNIKDFKSSFSDLTIEITGIEIADKDKLSHNLVQVKKIDFDLGFSALIQRKAFIENLHVEALAFDEKRANPATAHSSSSSGTTSSNTSLTKEDMKKEKTPATNNPFAMPSVDDILKKEKLKSVEEAEILKADIEATKQKWTNISDELKNAKEVDEIKQDAKNLQNLFKSGNFSKIASAKKDLDKIKKKIKALKAKYKNLDKEFKSDQKRIQNRIASLKDLPKQDIARLKKKYSLDASGRANIVGTLIDDEVASYMQTALKYYEMIKPYMKKSSKEDLEEKVPPRGEGRWIKFANLSTTPNVVIKNAKISVALKSDTIEIVMKDFSTDQKMYKKPMTLHVDAKGASYKHIIGDLTDDRMTDVSKTSFDIKMTEFKIDEFDMQALSMTNLSANATFKGVVEDENIKAVSNIEVTKVKLKMGSQEFVNQLLEGISSFGVYITLGGDVKKPSIGVKSDLDKQLSKGLSKIASNAAKDFEKKLRAGIMGKVTGLSDGLSSNIGDIGSILGDKQSSLNGVDVSSKSSKDSGIGGFMKKFF